MATLGVRDWFKIWTQSGQENERLMKKSLLEGLDEFRVAKLDTLSLLKTGKDIRNPVVWWLEETGYPDTITATLSGSGTTLTASGNLFGTTVTNTLLSQVCREGTILQRPSDGLQVKVTTFPSSGLAMTVAAHGNTSGADDSAAISWKIITEVWSDYSDAESPRGLDRATRSVGTQIHAETFEIPKTRKNTAYEAVSNEVQHQMMRLLEKMRHQMAKAMVFSRPYYSGGWQWGNQTETPSMGGLIWWAEIIDTEMGSDGYSYKDLSNVVLTKKRLDDFILNYEQYRYADFNTGDWKIVCDPLTHAQIQDFDLGYRQIDKDDKRIGFKVDIFDSKIGASFQVVRDNVLRDRPGTLMLCNFAKHHYGYFADDKMDRKEINTSGRYQQWLISFQTYGVVSRNPKSNIAVMYGIKTS